MKDNDLSAAPTPRYYVLSDVVFRMKETTVVKRKMLRTSTSTEWVVSPDMAVLSLLWRFSEKMGVRMELIFVGERAVEMAPGLWEMLDETAANPFNDWQAMENYHGILRDLPYRPDILGVIALPTDSAHFGGRGLTIANLH